jgi:hypothetical protein
MTELTIVIFGQRPQPGPYGRNVSLAFYPISEAAQVRPVRPQWQHSAKQQNKKQHKHHRDCDLHTYQKLPFSAVSLPTTEQPPDTAEKAIDHEDTG